MGTTMGWPKPVLSWVNVLKKILASKIYGIEFLGSFIVASLRILSLSFWIVTYAFSGATPKQDAQKDAVTELYVIGALIILLALLFWPNHYYLSPAIAVYILAESFVSIFFIVLLAKPEPKGPPVALSPISTERSLLLFLINAAQITVAFAIFYRAIFENDPEAALLQSVLVFATIATPVLSPGAGMYIVICHIACNFVFLAIFLSACVGKLKAFERG
jgi:hypothetical protein